MGSQLNVAISPDDLAKLELAVRASRTAAVVSEVIFLGGGRVLHF